MAYVAIQNVNLNDTAAWDGKASMLPPGEYLFQVEGCILGQSSKGNPQLEFDLVVVQGADGDTLTGAKTKHWVVMTEKAAGRVRNIIDACGVQLDTQGGFDSDHFVGAQFIAEVELNTYEKVDTATGQSVSKTNTKIQCERPVASGFSGQTTSQVAPAAPAAPVAPAAPAQPAQPAAPAARPVRGPANPPGPRAAVANSVRAPLPVRRG